MEEQMSRHTEGVLDCVAEERLNQLDKWGEQSHADGTDNCWEAEADVWKQVNDDNVTRTGDTDWTCILLEEVYEAVAETDVEKLRAELIQVAAVAVAWVEDIDYHRSVKE